MTLTRLAFFKLLAAVGIGQSSNVIQTPVEGPFSDGQGGCFTNHKHVLGDIKRVPCKEGDEYCPLGHSQKPERYEVLHTISSQCMDALKSGKSSCPGEESLHLNQHVCFVCGIVYVKQESK